ncbi:beta-glucosidase BglX [Haladaptatus sp. AB618]|uniref:beta-glucosidase BglX n=1 Tax=Haladaptatus sp. AB618 TaxID=2934173 RepID=UPI00209C004F|nr:beta-glucosidase BglX [Haladaptatus sp. AB618]MCO8256615.1 beta-glucosidase BglX [Haladaptatus sp. AB618]
MAANQDSEDPEEEIPFENEIDGLLARLTLKEKVGQLNQLNGSEQTGPAVEDVDLEDEIRNGKVGSVLNADGLENRERYQRIAVEETEHGVPLLFGYDVIHGFRTLSPIPLGEAASWDPDAVRASANVAAAEASASGIHWTFGPPVDVARDARWGRSMETSGEDPYLAGELAAARVRGFQGDDLTAADTVLACAKHYAAYGEVKAGREYNTVDISESTLRDIHLPPFEAAVTEGVGTVMNAFTVFEGIPAGASKRLVRDVLKDEWAFDGFVVSDWNSFREFIYHGVAGDERDAAELAIEAGSDMDMVGHIYTNELVNLVEDGTIDEALVDDAVRRVLRSKYRLGLFEDPYRYFDDERRKETVLNETHREIVRDVARKSIVLMKNERDVLPLDDVDSIAVVGALADSADDVLGDWRGCGRPEDAVSVLDGIEGTVDNAEVRYAQGCDRSGMVSATLREEAIETVEETDVAVVAVGESYELSGEASSRSDIDLPGEQQELLEALQATGTPVVAVLMNGRPLALPWLSENVPAILETWFLGTEAGDAIADVLFGNHQPSGRLPMSFPQTVGQVPIHYNHLPTGRPQHRAEAGWGTSYLDIPNDPLYAFGHGLSYTTFEYADLELGALTIKMNEPLSIGLTVENIGDVVGTEVVQVYIHDLVGSRARPVKELKRFRKLELEPGERREVTFEIESDDLAFWTADEVFAAEPGEFDVMIGHASDDIRLTDSFELRA